MLWDFPKKKSYRLLLQFYNRITLSHGCDRVEKLCKMLFWKKGKRMKKKNVYVAILSVLTAGTLMLQTVGCGVGEDDVQAQNLMKDVKAQKASGKEADENFENSYLDFSLNLFQNSLKESEEENLLISPLSVQLALAMTANGADGKTKQQMEAVLGGWMTVEELNRYLYSYRERKNNSQLRIANSIWFQDDAEKIQIEESFLETNASYYDAGVYEAPFDQQTVTDINNWISKNTDGMIENMLEQLDEDAVMCLVNALAFEGEWKEVYTTDQILEGTFLNEAGIEQKVSMMHSSENYYLEEENAIGFIKDYKDGKYSFAALLPKEGMSLEAYVNTLDSESLQKTLKEVQTKEVYAAIPKFSYEYSFSMENILKGMGMEDAFSAEEADFSKLGTSSQGNIYIGEVLHKTFITVDELGTKAGAATVVEMYSEGAMIEEPKVVELNRPFFYMILDNETGLPVFMGTVTDLAE